MCENFCVASNFKSQSELLHVDLIIIFSYKVTSEVSKNWEDHNEYKFSWWDFIISFAWYVKFVFFFLC